MKQELAIESYENDPGAGDKRQCVLEVSRDQIILDLKINPTKPLREHGAAGVAIEWDNDKGWRIYLYSPTQDEPFAAFNIDDDGQVERIEV